MWSWSTKIKCIIGIKASSRTSDSANLQSKSYAILMLRMNTTHEIWNDFHLTLTFFIQPIIINIKFGKTINWKNPMCILIIFDFTHSLSAKVYRNTKDLSHQKSYIWSGLCLVVWRSWCKIYSPTKPWPPMNRPPCSKCVWVSVL